MYECCTMHFKITETFTDADVRYVSIHLQTQKGMTNFLGKSVVLGLLTRMQVIVIIFAIIPLIIAKNHGGQKNGLCPKYWKEVGDTCYKQAIHKSDIFDALRSCNLHREYDHFLYQNINEDSSLLLTIGKLYNFFIRSDPQDHFKSKVWINAIKYDGKWIEIHQVLPKESYIELHTILSANLGQEIFDVDFKHFGFDPTTGQDLDGLVFDPKTNKLEISSTSNAFSYICTHKKLKRPGTKCPGKVAECSDRGYCYHGYCQCREGFSGLSCLPSKKNVN